MPCGWFVPTREFVMSKMHHHLTDDCIRSIQMHRISVELNTLKWWIEWLPSTLHQINNPVIFCVSCKLHKRNLMRNLESKLRYILYEAIMPTLTSFNTCSYNRMHILSKQNQNCYVLWIPQLISTTICQYSYIYNYIVTEIALLSSPPLK